MDLLRLEFLTLLAFLALAGINAIALVRVMLFSCGLKVISDAAAGI
ncbi:MULTISPECIES: hypothetical protein [Stenotrophomonas]|nr:hypothetical protein [Stenotrophomonas maltophilia]